MGEQKCNLIFTGDIAEGKTLEEVQAKLAGIFKTDIENIRKMFGSSRSIIKKNADKTMCKKMMAVLTEAGAICDIEPIQDQSPEVSQTEVVTPAAPEPEPENPSDPYAAPQSDIETFPQTGISGFSGPNKVPASNGAAWIFQSFGLLKKNPLNWFLAMVLYFIVNLIQIIPVLGAIIVTLIGPALLGGFVLGAKELDEGESLNPTCIFYGFKKNFGQLVLFAFVFFFSVIIIMGGVAGIMAAVFGLNMAMFSDPGTMAGSSMLMFALIPLIMLLLVIPIIMCYWFTPALILINDVSIPEAVKMSFSGCLKNFLAFLINGLVMLGLVIGCFVVVGILASVFRTLMGDTGSLIVTFITTIPLMLVFMPLGIGIIYASYKDIFYN